jgi:hypothetical protein
VRKIQETVNRTENFEKIKEVKDNHKRRLEEYKDQREQMREEQRRLNLHQKAIQERRIHEA